MHKLKRPAKVKYNGEPSNEFDIDGIYNAYFVEYWQGTRNNLNVRNKLGEIVNFVDLADFEIIEDRFGVLRTGEAIVKAKKSSDAGLSGVTKDREYRAIGLGIQHHHPYYLVLDNCYDNYFYPPDWFDIISDPDGVLDPMNGIYIYCWNRKEVIVWSDEHYCPAYGRIIDNDLCYWTEARLCGNCPDDVPELNAITNWDPLRECCCKCRYRDFPYDWEYEPY